MKNILLLTCLIFGLTSSYGQIINQNQEERNNWRVGISGGLSFGNNDYFSIGISPTVGYDLGKGLEGGIVAGYQHASSNYFSSNLISGGPYINYSFIPQMFIRTNYSYYSGKQNFKNSGYESSINESALWIGGGYQSTGRVGFRAGLMYNVLYKENSSIFSSAFSPFAGVVFSL